MHIKAMRVFVESVLRYGVPPEFVSCTMYCKDDKKVRKNLTELYHKLTNSRDSDFTKGLSNEQKQLIEQHMASLNLEDSYEPYLIMPFNTLVNK